MKENLKIPTLSPILFRQNHIKDNKSGLLDDDSITQFFIHYFKEGDVYFNLALPPHKKTVNDFVFIIKGRMTKTVGIESFDLMENDFLITPKNNITSTKLLSDDLEGFYCHFSNEFIGANPFLDILYTQPSKEDYFHFSQEESDNLFVLLSRILVLYRSRKEHLGNYRLITFYLSTIIAELFLTFREKQVNPSKKKELFPLFNSLIHARFKQNWTIKEYASQLNCTPNHLNKRVKTETGRTASEIIKEVIVLEAKVLLHQTSLTVKEISQELGFEDASYFSRYFKNETNFTPSNYRKMIDLS